MSLQKQLEHVDDNRILFMFSAGKDSILALYLLSLERPSFENVSFVYLYFVPGLAYVERTLQHYERRYGISIERHPSPDTLGILAKRSGCRKVGYKMADCEHSAMAITESKWLMSGAKRADSFARRGMLRHVSADGIDEQYNKLYPLIDFTDAQVSAIVKMRRLHLPVTYHLGFKRSLWVPNKDALRWMREYLPDDYEKIVAYLPEVEYALLRERT